MKVFGIGFARTGTKTLGACLEHWKLNHQSFRPNALRLWHEGAVEELIRMAGEFDSCEDWPWPLLYKELDEAFPGSKFILTRRTSAEKWLRSYSGLANRKRSRRTTGEPSILGFATVDGFEAEHIRRYEEHNQSVRDYFRDRPEDLLEVCWEEGHGWKELAPFLGFEVPRRRFPHLNRGTQSMSQTEQVIRRWVRVIRPRRKNWGNHPR